jgi:hypothetical protein
MIYTHIFDREVETARRFFRQERILAQEHNITMDFRCRCECNHLADFVWQDFSMYNQ